MDQKHNIVFLDSNIFHDNWYLKGAKFTLLFHYLSNTWGELALSDVVVKEVENTREVKVKKEISTLKKTLSELAKLTGIVEDKNFKPEDYSLVELLRSKTEHLKLISSTSLSHDEIVTRAVKRIRPFRENEKGYRDTVIWLSLLTYLRGKKDNRSVHFVTKNHTDFFQSKKGKFELHPHLKNDLVAYDISNEIVPHNSLYTFIKSAVDADEHAINREAVENSFEEYVGEELEYFLDEVGSTGVDHNFFFDLTLLPKGFLPSDIKFTVYEGTEDPEIVYTKKLGNDVYVEYAVRLEGVVAELDLPYQQYLQDQSGLNKKLGEPEILGDTVRFSRWRDHYFNVEFLYDTVTEECRDFQVSHIESW